MSTHDEELDAVISRLREVLKKKKVLGSRRFARFRESVEEPIAAILTCDASPTARRATDGPGG